jgi:hypothetical protein
MVALAQDEKSNDEARVTSGEGMTKIKIRAQYGHLVIVSSLS